MKLDISKIDPNFLIGSQIDKTDLVWLNVLDAPFSIHGLAVTEKGKFYRLPEPLVDQVNDGIKSLGRHTTGGRIRFRTDSPYIAYRAKPLYMGSMSHMPLTGSVGTDIFVNGKSLTTFRPANDHQEWYEGCVDVQGAGIQDVELNLPLYNGLTEIFVGLKKGATLESPRPYAIEKPIVYYGNSVTQGGCASKPGNSYQGFLSRWLNADHINLGFSGSGCGEENMAEYIAGLEMSALVMDYDYNAPNAEYLRKTHYRFYEIIRKAQPDLPILMNSMMTDRDIVDTEERREVILQTYLRARAEGDRKIWFVDGRMLFGGKDRDCCTMDGAHPNDLGFYRIAENYLPLIREALGV